jgi:hypothetical protein
MFINEFFGGLGEAQTVEVGDISHHVVGDHGAGRM